MCEECRNRYSDYMDNHEVISHTEKPCNRCGGKVNREFSVNIADPIITGHMKPSLEHQRELKQRFVDMGARDPNSTYGKNVTDV